MKHEILNTNPKNIFFNGYSVSRIEGFLPSFRGTSKHEFFEFMMDEAPRVRVIPNKYDIILIDVDNVSSVNACLLIYKIALELRELKMFSQVESLEKDEDNFPYNYLAIHTEDHTFLSHVPAATLPPLKKKEKMFFSDADLEYAILNSKQYKNEASKKYSMKHILNCIAVDYNCDKIREMSMADRIRISSDIEQDRLNLVAYCDDINLLLGGPEEC